MKFKLKRAISVLAAVIVTTQFWLVNDAAAMCNSHALENSQVNIEELSYEVVREEIIETLNDKNGRATNKFDWSVQPGTMSKASTAFSLESGETVEINCTFSPKKAEMDFGLIAPDGLFYHAEGNNGNFELTIQVKETGKYYFAVRNNSDKTVEVMGFVYY